MLEKAVALKRFQHSQLDKELKAQTGNAKKQYQKLDKIYEFEETINKKPIFENYSKLDLTDNINYSFYKYYRNNKKFNNYSLK